MSERVGPDTLWGMCMAVECPKCQRPTWSGCGAHVEQVLGDVPQSERCKCPENANGISR